MRRKLSAATKKDQVSHQKSSIESSQLFDLMLLNEQLVNIFYWDRYLFYSFEVRLKKFSKLSKVIVLISLVGL